MSSLVEMLKIETTSFKRYMDLLDVLMENFKQRFHDLDGRERSHDLFRDPFSDLAENFEDDPALQLEILNIQSCFTLKTSFRELPLIEFYKQINVEQYPKILKNACFWAVQFGSTYLCEQCFSLMKLTKSKHRSRITDDHLDCTLRLAISPITPNLGELVEGKQCQTSVKFKLN